MDSAGGCEQARWRHALCGRARRRAIGGRFQPSLSPRAAPLAPCCSAGDFTVTSPGLAKNALSVGATQTWGDAGPPPANITALDVTASGTAGSALTFRCARLRLLHGGIGRVAAGTLLLQQAACPLPAPPRCRALPASFGPSAEALLAREPAPLVIAKPLNACEPLLNAAEAAGSVVLAQRVPGLKCDAATQAWQAGNAGAAALLIYEDGRDPYTRVERRGRECNA